MAVFVVVATVQTDASTLLKLTGSPEVAVAETSPVPPTVPDFETEVKVIVCDCGAAAFTVTMTGALFGFQFASPACVAVIVQVPAAE